MSRGLSSAVTAPRNSASAEAKDVMRMMLDVWCVCLECSNANAVVKRGQIVNTVIVESVGQLPVLAPAGWTLKIHLHLDLDVREPLDHRTERLNMRRRSNAQNEIVSSTVRR
jgi:hypothetical protein